MFNDHRPEAHFAFGNKGKHEGVGHGIDTQLQSVTVKTHASSGAQNPSHDGESASPHGVFRHSHEPPEATAEQWPASPHVPSHFRSLLLKSHGPGGTVVVVVEEPTVAGPRDAGAHNSCARLKVTARWPPKASVICAADGNGRGQTSG